MDDSIAGGSTMHLGVIAFDTERLWVLTGYLHTDDLFFLTVDSHGSCPHNITDAGHATIRCNTFTGKRRRYSQVKDARCYLLRVGDHLHVRPCELIELLLAAIQCVGRSD